MYKPPKGMFLTAVRISPAKSNFSIPRILALENAQLVQSKPRSTGGAGGNAYVQYGTGGRPFSKKFRVMETVFQIEVAKNPISTNIEAQDKTLSITAAGTAQGTATALTKYFNEVTTATAGATEGVRLDAATVGKVRVVLNNDAADTVKVYPATSEKIINSAGTDLGANAAQDLVVGARKHYVCLVAGVWQEALLGS